MGFWGFEEIRAAGPASIAPGMRWAEYNFAGPTKSISGFASLWSASCAAKSLACQGLSFRGILDAPVDHVPQQCHALAVLLLRATYGQSGSSHPGISAQHGLEHQKLADVVHRQNAGQFPTREYG